MDRDKDKLLSESIGKTISVYYNDTLNSVSFKLGKLIDFDRYSIKLLENSNGRLTIIPRSKYIRIEFLTGEQYEHATTK